MAFILQEPWAHGISIQFALSKVYLHQRTAFQELMIVETEHFGRALFLDGLVQSTEADEALYHESFVHPAFVIHGGPRRVLIGGTGEGATLREVLRHPSVEHVLSVDLDREVVEACREHLPGWSQGAFDDPRVTLRYENIQQTLLHAEPGRFDAVLLDITDPVEEGPAVDLFTTRFYRSVERVMADDGIMVLQAGEMSPRDMQASRTVRSTLCEVFPWVHFLHVHLPSFQSIYGLALAAKQPMDVDPPDLEERIERLPTEKLRVYTPISHRAVLELPPFLQRKLAEPGRVVSGDTDERLVTFRRATS